MESRFFTCTGKLNLRTSKVSFMATGAFMDNTIWIGNSMAATQSILDIAMTCLNTLLSYGLSLGSSVINMFYANNSVAAADVLGLNAYIKIKRLNPKRPIPGWFVFLVNFIESGGLVDSSILLQLSSLKFCLCNDGYVKDCLEQVDSDIIHVYTDSSVKDLGSFGARGGTAAYFSSTNVGVCVRVLSLLSSMLAEMQAITLALDCVSDHSLVNKVRGHTSVVDNKHTDFFVRAATSSNFILLIKTSLYFLSVEDRPLSNNAYYIVSRLYNTVNFVGWESKYASDIVNGVFSSLIDKHHTFNIWHVNSHVRFGYTGSATATLHSYFIKTLHHWLPMAKRKKLYNLGYSSVLCILYGLLEDSDHSFVFVSDANTCKDLILDAIKDWTILLDACATCSIVVCLLHETMSSDHLYITLSKGFMLKEWVDEARGLLGDNSNSGALIIDLVHYFAKSHRSGVWMPRAKLRAYYKKHSLLPCDKSIILLVSGLFLV
ncbi:hypothetical protein G9A89_023830 [Geosiphon pyriformis]|nr:hypothetical protein G9A89_023830 [Geosiphon pyriformis]